MIRSSRHILKYQNQGKTDWLDKLFEDYLKELRCYINLIQTGKLPLDKNLSSKQLGGDFETRNKNIKSGKKLCKRCDGTGNEFFSMYKRCTKCFGTGVANAIERS
ncbi:MAG TPA: hypothetical protein PLI22_03025 [Caldisericia bacterium]|nr:hypothetical protein [Caldisericia bacterium]